MPTLHWLTREQDLKAASNAEYRLLVEEEKFSCGDPDTGNLIVQGDNLEALKALLPFYAGQVKCIYIDPPYNTGSAFEQYDDNMEHTKWLSMMYPRLELLKKFLQEDGAIWISIDDDESHYLKIACDEVFGRNNFVSSVVWEKKYAPQGNAQWLSDSHDYILLYAKAKKSWKPNLLPRTDEMDKKYKNPDNDPRGLWRVDNATISLSGGQRGAQYARTGVSENIYELVSPTGKIYLPPKGRCWYYPKEKMLEAIKEGRIFFSKNGEGAPTLKRYMNEVKQGAIAKTLWFREDVGDNQEAKREVIVFNSDSVFSTPKPERLMQRILTLSTAPGDYVLDSFLGSGTTAAVAHKMGRRYIGVEMGEQAKTHCAARLKKVIAGEQGGISKAVGWKGGGGFRFFKLGPAVFDSERRIKPDISFENLAAHIYFTETKTPMEKRKKNSTFLGVHDGTAYALLYNGILGDKRVNGGNVLTHATLNHIMNDIDMAAKKKGEEIEYHQMVIYGEATRLTYVSLEFNNIIFKQTPYDIKVW